MKKLLLNEKNHEKRFGSICSECKGKLGKVFMEGNIDGKSVRFCSFKCQDDYIDKKNSRDMGVCTR